MDLQDNQLLDIWVTVLLLVVPMIVFAARLYVRLTNKTFGLDDALMAAGAFFYIFQCTTVIGGATAGIGLKNEHITDHAQYVAAGRVSLAYDRRTTIDERRSTTSFSIPRLIRRSA